MIDVLRFPNVHYYANRHTNLSIFPYFVNICEDKEQKNKWEGICFFQHNRVPFGITER